MLFAKQMQAVDRASEPIDPEASIVPRAASLRRSHRPRCSEIGDNASVKTSAKADGLQQFGDDRHLLAGIDDRDRPFDSGARFWRV